MRVSLLLLAMLLVSTLGCSRWLELATGVPVVRPAELSKLLASDDPPIVVDVRPPGAYEAGHVPGAVSVQLADLDAYLESRDGPAGRALVTVCEHGHASLLAAAIALGHGRRMTKSLEGGTSAWRDAGLTVQQGAERQAAHASWHLTVGRPLEVIAVLSGMVLKPTYMLFSFVLIRWLRKVKRGPLRKIAWGLVSFLAGETFCAIDYYFGQHALLMPIDLLHGLGMVGMGILVPWGLYQLLDERILHFGNPDQRCMFQRFCVHCHKQEPVSCGAHRMFLFTAIALAIVALAPLSVSVQSPHFVASIGGTPVDYGPAVFNQIIEHRGYALLGSILMATAAVRLFGGPSRIHAAKLPFFVGLGFGSFALFRFLLTFTFVSMPIWTDFWEEATEWLAVAGLGIVLWIFREQLDLPRKGSREAQPTSARSVYAAE